MSDITTDERDPDDRWSKFYPYRFKGLSDDERRQCKELQSAESLAWYVVKMMFGRHMSNRVIERIVDRIWLEGYREAKKGFDPSKNTEFTTYLSKIYRNKTYDERTKYLISIPKTRQKLVVTVSMKGNLINSRDFPVKELGLRGLRQRKYVFDFTGSRNFFFPLDFKIPFPIEELHEEFEEGEQPAASMSESMAAVGYEEFLEAVGRIGENEIQNINDRRIPILYKRLTRSALKSLLSRIDVQIVEKLLEGYEYNRNKKNENEPKVTQQRIQQALGIKRNFYEFRLEAIAKRLELQHLTLEHHLASRKMQKENPKEYCVRKTCLMAIRMNAPVLKRIFVFRTKECRDETLVGQGSLFVDEKNKQIYIWCDPPQPQDGVEEDRDSRRNPDEHWSLVEDYYERFVDI